MNTAIEEYLEACTSEALDYTNHHKDSGDNYATLVPDNLDQRELANYLDMQCIDTCGLDIDTIADTMLLHFKMRPAHMFESRQPDLHSFTITSLQVGEIETQISYTDIEEATDIRLVNEAVLSEAGYGDYHHDNDSITITTSSDFIWVAYITREGLKEIITDY